MEGQLSWLDEVGNALVRRGRRLFLPDYGPTLMRHWNGRVWSSPRLPALRPVNKQTGAGPAGLILLRWNGSTWNMVASDMKLSSTNILTRLTPDGRGGFWLTATDPVNSRAGDIVDYRHDRFTSQRGVGTKSPLRTLLGVKLQPSRMPASY